MNAREALAYLQDQGNPLDPGISTYTEALATLKDCIVTLGNLTSIAESAAYRVSPDWRYLPMLADAIEQAKGALKGES